MDNIMGYCVKEKKKVQIIDPKLYRTEKGGYILKGTDAQGHKVNRFVSKDWVNQVHGKGLLGNLLGLPGGKVPGLSSIPLLGALF